MLEKFYTKLGGVSIECRTSHTLGRGETIVGSHTGHDEHGNQACALIFQDLKEARPIGSDVTDELSPGYLTAIRIDSVASTDVLLGRVRHIRNRLYAASYTGA